VSRVATAAFDPAAIFVGPDLGDGHAAGGQDALQGAARCFRLEVFAGAAGMEFRRIERAQRTLVLISKPDQMRTRASNVSPSITRSTSAG
jgi:hypothetical protein